MIRPTDQFKTASQNHAKKKKRGGWPIAYDELLKTIETCTRGKEDLNVCEPQLRQAFMKFMHDCRFPLAAKNFEALLLEKSDKKFLRSDGSINWFHEFIPIMMALSLIRKTRRNDGIDLADLDQYGGIEVMICTHLRHDSVEDFITKEELLKQQENMMAEIQAEDPNYTEYKGRQKIDQIMINNDLMTQRKLTDESGNIIYKDGKPVKEAVVYYIRRMVYSENANPVVFLLKQLDRAHNLATIFGAGKFSLDRRAKRCNETENMYGPRQDFYVSALNKWKPFAKAISMADGVVGDLLYKHFRYLETVDLFYKDAPEAFRREPNPFPPSTQFMAKAMKFNIPEILHPIHIGHKRILGSVVPTSDPARYVRFKDYLRDNLMPTLEDHKNRFYYMFAGVKNLIQVHSAPVAMP